MKSSFQGDGEDEHLVRRGVTDQKCAFEDNSDSPVENGLKGLNGPFSHFHFIDEQMHLLDVWQGGH